MYSLKNKVTLIGNLGKDPELKEFGSDKKKLLKVSIATNDAYKNGAGEKVEETQWHNIVAWGKNAEIMGKYLVKGSEVVIEGKLVNNNYTDKEGIKRYSNEVHVMDFLLLGSKK
jgi:single-strand DNA-binding protein